MVMKNLCIACWFAECGGDHRDPALDCPCCEGVLEPKGINREEMRAAG